MGRRGAAAEPPSRPVSLTFSPRAPSLPPPFPPDGVGFVFGWNGIDDHYQAAMINDGWPSQRKAADGVGSPAMKISRRVTACGPSLDDAHCFELLAYLDSAGASANMARHTLGAVGEHFASAYVPYTYEDVLYLVVAHGEARWGRWDAALGQWVMTWATLPADYAGGKVGFFLSADQAAFGDVKITDLDATPYPTMCNGGGVCELGACACGAGDAAWASTGVCEPAAPSQRTESGCVCLPTYSYLGVTYTNECAAATEGDDPSHTWCGTEDGCGTCDFAAAGVEPGECWDYCASPTVDTTGDGVLDACWNTCNGRTCDYWVHQADHTCEDEEEQYGCDCSGCECLAPSAAPTISMSTVAHVSMTITGLNCDEYQSKASNAEIVNEALRATVSGVVAFSAHTCAAIAGPVASEPSSRRRRRLGASDSVLITMDVTVRAAAYGSMSESEISEDVQSTISLTASKGTLTTTLKEKAAERDATSPLVAATVSPTDEGSSTTKKVTSAGVDGSVVGIILAVSLGLVAATGGAAFYYGKKKGVSLQNIFRPFEALDDEPEMSMGNTEMTSVPSKFASGGTEL